MSSEANAAMQSSNSDRVRQLVDRYAAAWNASDMDAMAKLYVEDVHWVNIVGMHWQGKAQVDRAHRAYFDIMFRGVPLTLETVESVVVLSEDTVVAVIRWSVGAFKTPFGEQMPPSRDRMSLVLVPKGDGLVIAHGSNVQINELAQRSDPIGQKRDS
ncbi:SgcJ/EcaC family oxidoreductase [Sphingomonas sp. CFBP 13720]|uniref:SgcJ/EcaC family oxidoreductase n=1 Tax=Sphingomonas sp. CFBP 13720 TaxID=2775302 RepID=UPI00177C8D80|nr:SgcJ/EcaC family oxidoreductase [Sphingomonas sp. CFBP 13720]MBD8679857.1 SgcJ/EcaC family oxidoreductase [Sphingomonas sp. CFBP 13720]